MNVSAIIIQDMPDGSIQMSVQTQPTNGGRLAALLREHADKLMSEHEYQPATVEGDFLVVEPSHCEEKD